MKKDWIDADGKFQELTDEQRKDFTAEQNHAYYADKLKNEGERIEAKLKELEEADEEKSAEIDKQLQDMRDAEMKVLKSALVEQGKVLKGLKEGRIKAADVANADISVTTTLGANKSALDAIKLGESFEDAEGKTRNRLQFELKFHEAHKAATDMLLSTNVSGGTMPQQLRLEGVNDIAERAVVTYPLIPKLNTDRTTIEWVYEANQDGTIDGTAEGAAKDQIDNDFVIDSLTMKKRAAYMKVSMEMLDDVSFMSGWLRNKLLIRLFIDVDNQCLNGDGAGNNLSGLIDQSTAFAAGVFAATVDNANFVDVLTVAVNQVKIANQSVLNLSIQMNPSDVTALKLVKLSTTDKRYIDRLITVAGSMNLDGVPIIENNNMTVDDFLVQDTGKALIAQKGGITIDVGLDGNDFTNNMRTILAEWRGLLLIETNDRTSFVTGDFTTAAAALETP